jgi:hypothetical protein
MLLLTEATPCTLPQQSTIFSSVGWSDATPKTVDGAGTVKSDGESGSAEPLLGDVSFDGVPHGAISAIDLGFCRGIVRRGLAGALDGLDILFAKELFAGFFDETE